MGVPKLCFLLVLSVLYSEITSVSTSSSCGVTVILLGSTGDLAKRYIWPALFENHAQLLSQTDERCHTYSLLVYGASRSAVTDREATLTHLMTNIRCPGDPCDRQTLKDFQDSTNFVKLTSEADYPILSEMIRQDYHKKNTVEIVRIVYLAIPPTAYSQTIKHVKTFLSPDNELSWLRVVLEKPFGHDLSSAKDLSKQVSEYLKESEVYRIDHYLGKFGVQQIQRFLSVNSESLMSIWNRDGIQLIEVAMEETLDVRGRTGFYDSNGVIRDVHQNHLTEILLLLLMDSSTDGFQTEKLKVLSNLYPPRLHHTVLGQYSDYQKHLREDGVNSNGSVSMTPTYASIALYSKDPRWIGVPFVLTSGKQLGQRRAFVRVILKRGHFPNWDKMDSCHPEMRFIIHQDGLKPGVFLSRHFSSFNLNHDRTFAEWTKTDYSDPDRGCSFIYLHPNGDINTNSYVSLISAVLKGDRECFVDSESLLESWKVWTPLLEEIELSHPKLITYSPDNLEDLQSRFHETKLITHKQDNNIDTFLLPELFRFSVSLDSSNEGWFGHRAVLSNKYKLSSLLASDLYDVALSSVKKSGSFHLALPGGTTPLLLFNTLSLEYQHSFPWKHTHIWQTDERCVESSNKNSNLYQLSDYLISLVPIPYYNIHPMPVHLQGGLCTPDDNGPGLYEREMLEHGQLDYVLLGVGSDGHVASLFPTKAVQDAYPSDGKFVEIVQIKTSCNIDITCRMTLSLKNILSAKKIGIVITGVSKREIFNRVKNCLENKYENDITNDCTELPVMKVILSADKEQLTIYVDSTM